MNGYWRYARQQFARFVFQRGEISNDENFGMAGQAEIGIHEHASGAIDGHAQLFAERRSGHARRPQNDGRIHRFCFASGLTHVNCARLDLRHHG